MPISNPPKAVIFDLAGTCTNWHSILLPLLETSPPVRSLPLDTLSDFASAWRAGFFTEIHARFAAGEPPEDIDVTHRRVLDRLLEEPGVGVDAWNEGVRKRLVEGWHHQRGGSR